MLVKSTGLRAREAQVLRADAARTEALQTPPHRPSQAPATRALIYRDHLEGAVPHRPLGPLNIGLPTLSAKYTL